MDCFTICRPCPDGNVGSVTSNDIRPCSNDSVGPATSCDNSDTMKIKPSPYDISSRIAELAKPKIYPNPKPKTGLTKFGVSKKAMEPQNLSERLKELATAKQLKDQSPKDAAKNVGAPKTFKYKLSKRIIALAKPRTVKEKYKSNKAN